MSLTKASYSMITGAPVNVLDFGAVGNFNGSTGTDNLAAFQAALASFSTAYNAPPYSYAGELVVPPGKYYFSGTWNIDRQVRVVGQASPDGNAIGDVQLIFADNINGIVIQSYLTSSSGTDAGGTSIENLSVICHRTSGTDGSGIFLKARARLRNVLVYNFRDNGIHIEATESSSTGNANLWQIDSCRSIGNSLDGLYVDGADVNAGVAIRLDCSDNGRWGINDSSFLGNTYVACHAQGNTSGAYKTDNLNAQSVFLGCYSEPGQPASSFSTPTVVIGGLHGAGLGGASKATLFGSGGLGGFTVGGMQGNAIDGNCGINIGNGVTSEEFAVVYGTNVSPFRWKSRTGEVYWNWANFSDVFAFYDKNQYVTRDLSSIGTVPGFPAGFLAEGQLARLTLSAAPTTGTWRQGDIVFNNAPTAGGTIGWVCTSAGTPGTWKTFGAISV